MLKELNPFITLNLTTEEAIEYNALVEKSIPKFGLKASGLEEYYNYCPMCHSLVHHNDNYCTRCGQKVEFVDYTELRNSNDESVENDEKTAEIENMSRTEPSADDIIPFDSDEF